MFRVEDIVLSIFVVSKQYKENKNLLSKIYNLIVKKLHNYYISKFLIMINKKILMINTKENSN